MASKSMSAIMLSHGPQDQQSLGEPIIPAGERHLPPGERNLTRLQETRSFGPFAERRSWCFRPLHCREARI